MGANFNIKAIKVNISTQYTMTHIRIHIIRIHIIRIHIMMYYIRMFIRMYTRMEIENSH